MIDTICVSIPTYQRLVIAKEQKKVLEQQVVILNDRISTYQLIVGNLKDKDSVTVAAYEKQIQLYKDEKDIYEDQLKGYEKLLKRQKRKTFFTAAGGVLATGLTMYLYLTK